MITKVNYNKLLIDRIEENIKLYPQKVVYSFCGVATTYEQMNTYSDSIASAIESQLSEDALTRKRSVRIGICLPRNSHFYSCVLASAKLGCSYVPVDVETPKNRLDFIISDSMLDVVIKEDNIESMLSYKPHSTHKTYLKEDQEAYMIYTSGTTGTPKGVCQTYRTIFNYISRATQPEDFHVTSESKVLMFASINFDVSVMEIFLPMFAGCTAIIAQDEERYNVKKLYKLLQDEQITFCYLPPSLLSIFPDFNLPHLETLSAGGEAIPHSLTKKIVGNYPFRFVNGYGPAESFYATTYVYEDAEQWACIGKTVPGVVGHVVDEDMNLVAPGESGELLLGGAQLFNGYWNRPELNETKLIPNPFDQSRDIAPILYHSGDIVQLREDGAYNFIGRADSMVKLHGYRIELEEITTRIEHHPRVRRAFTRIEEFNNDKHLVTYVCTEDASEDLRDIRQYLSEHVPEYMVPIYWNHVDEFVLNINGKIDKSALVNKAWERLFTSCPLPTTESETTLMNGISHMLGVEQISIDADLISEVGLTSLKIMQIPTEVISSGLNVNVDEIYKYRTIREIIANHLTKISFWYNDPTEHPERPVIIYILGYPFLEYCNGICKRLAQNYNLFVIESHQTILNNELTTVKELIGIYDDIVAPIIEEYNVVAYAGYCLGGEHALLVAHDMHNDSDKKPYVFVIDGEVDRDKDPDHFIPLEWPALNKEQNARRKQLDLTLYATYPDDHIYNGPVVSFVCEQFDEQQTVTPEQQKLVSKELMDTYRQRFSEVPDIWRKVYPHASIITIPSSHYTCMSHDASLDKMYNYIHNEYLKLINE